MKKNLKVCIGHPSLFSAFELERFEEEILGNPKASEHDASKFFDKHPKFLLLGSGEEVRRETVLVAADKKPIGRVDFFRRAYHKKTWDIIELKRPHVPFFSGTTDNHPRLSAAVHRAVSQAQDYRQLIESTPTMRAELEAKGIKVVRPKMLVIAGREQKDVDELQAAELIDRIQRMGIELLTYDDLFSFAKSHYESSQVIFIPESTSPAVAASLLTSFIKIRVGAISPETLFDFAKEQFRENYLTTLVSEAVVESLPVFVFQKDTEGRFTFVNDALAKMLGTTAESLLGKNDEDFYASEEMIEQYREADRKILNMESKTVELEERFTTAEGSGLKVWTTKMPLFDKEGKLIGIEGIARMLPPDKDSSGAS